MGVYITGDCHGSWTKLKWYDQFHELTEEDFIIGGKAQRIRNKL